jgi:hypothetical protein
MRGCPYGPTAPQYPGDHSGVRILALTQAVLGRSATDPCEYVVSTATYSSYCNVLLCEIPYNKAVPCGAYHALHDTSLHDRDETSWNSRMSDTLPTRAAVSVSTL